MCELTRTEQTKWIVQSVLAQSSQNGVCELTHTAASSGQKFKVAYFWKLKYCFLAKFFSVEEMLATKFLFVRKLATNREARKILEPLCECELNRTSLVATLMPLPC